MDPASQHLLAQLIRTEQTAALGTLRDGAPFVSMVLYAPAPDFAGFLIHISTLAHHTRDILADNRVALMIAQPGDVDTDPQTLARLSIQGTASQIPTRADEYAEARALYLNRFPLAAFNFSLSDFSLYRIEPARARYVAGFGRIFNLNANSLRAAA